jgi:hypothetical protein
MSDTMTVREQGARVTGLWWDGGDLHVTTDDGQHSVYEGAFMMSRRMGYMGENVCQVTVTSPSARELEGEPQRLDLEEAMSYFENLRDMVSRYS